MGQVSVQSGGTGLGYLGQSATGSDSSRTPRIAWLIADTDPLGTHNGIAWLTGANNLVGGLEYRDRETPVCHLSSIGPYGCFCLWGMSRGGPGTTDTRSTRLPLGEGPGGPRTRDTRSTGLSAPLLPAADSSRVDLGCNGYLAQPRTWTTGGRRCNPGSQSPGAT